jgi:carboxyl-terminal processing protease
MTIQEAGKNKYPPLHLRCRADGNDLIKSSRIKLFGLICGDPRASMSQKKIQVWLPLMFAVVMILGMLIGFKLRENTRSTGNFFVREKRSPLQQVLDLINLKYVDSVKIDTLADDAIQEMLGHLDPHSIYIPPVELGEINEDLMGEFQGIGVEFHILNDTVNVVSVLEGGPSEKAGLVVGDQFVKVEGVSVAGKDIDGEKIKKLLRGPGASKVELVMLRNRELKNFTITRGSIPLPSLDAAYMITKETGLIRLNKFSKTTYEEFMQATEKLQAAGMKSMILDLRGNGGGILDEAVDVTDEFLDEGKLIVYTQGNKMPKEEYKSKRPGLFETGKLVVLTDEGSASASEVLAGALQDWDRATIIGRRSFGKGLVQEQFTLADGAALRLTVARYYTPSGRSIQKAYKDKGTYRHEIMDRFNHGDFLNADSNKVQQGSAYKTNNGRVVYGGGGIMPDVFVPYDTSAFSPALTNIYLSPSFNNYLYTYFIQHKNELKKYKSALEFVSSFKDEEQLWQGFAAYAAKDGIKLSELSKGEKALVQKRLLAMLARQPWRTEGYYEVLNTNDPVIKKALEELQK